MCFLVKLIFGNVCKPRLRLCGRKLSGSRTSKLHRCSLRGFADGLKPSVRVSASASEDVVLCRKMVNCPLRFGGELLVQVKECKYLRVFLFTSDGKMEREMDRWFCAVLHWSCVVKRELSQKVKLLIYQSIYVPTLTYGHKLWVVTKTSFLCSVAGLSLSDRVRSSVIHRELGVELPPSGGLPGMT